MKVYLRSFLFPTGEDENMFFNRQVMTCFNTFYPYGVFNGRLPELNLTPITIFYGGNGSGKSTILNVIAEKLKIPRHAPGNRSPFFEEYVNDCTAWMATDELGLEYEVPPGSRVIASDDVFQEILAVRRTNAEIDRQRRYQMQQYHEGRSDSNWGFDLSRPGDLERIRRNTSAKSRTASRFLRERVGFNKTERSNGESAIEYFRNTIGEESLYLLDEPENSLLPAMQLQLVDFLENSVRGVDDQFLIATHSPLLLSLRGATIYNLDADPVAPAKWYELENPRIYYEFFRKYAMLFEGNSPPDVPCRN